MRNKVYCDWCLNVINDDYDEVPILILELGCESYLFCCDDCLDEYIKESTLEKYVDYKGNIE